MKTKQLLMAAGLLSLVGCASNGQDSQVDHGDGVDSPDVLLQDTDDKSVKYGERDYGLARDAKKHDQQIKPDPLLAGVGNGHSSTESGDSTAAKAAEPSVQGSRTQPKTKPTKTPANKDDEARLKRDSSLEVDDPLLGEVDQ